MSAGASVVEDRRPASAISSGDEQRRDRARDPDAGAWPEEMESVRFIADTSLTIPGQSEPPGECGTWGPREFCNCCGEVVIGPKRCQRRICEHCWMTWRGNRAAAITRRLAGARQDAEGAEKRLSHVVVSPEPGEVRTLVDWEQAKSQAYDLAKEKGISGGVLIPHGWRVTEDAKEVWRIKRDNGDVDVGIWQWIREHDRSWRSLTYWSPHFHILGLGADLDESNPEGDDGWIFSRIDSFDRFKITDEETYRPMFKAAAYLLSHAGFEPDEGKQVVRWFGELANNQFSLEQLAEWVQSVIVRNVEKVAGYGVDDDDDGEKTCSEEGCEGGLSPIWEAGYALTDPGWCDRIGRETEHRLAVAFEWAIGERRPPPGLKRPQTEQEAKEAFTELL